MNNQVANTRGRKKRGNAGGILAGILIGGLIGIVGGWLFGRSNLQLGVEGVHPLVTFALLFVCIWLSLVLHEIGHLVGGMVSGMRPLLLVAGPLRLQREGDRMKPSWNRSLALAGGVAASIPPDDRDLRRRMALMIAGGPATSVVLALFGVLVYLASPNPELVMFGLLLAFCSGLIGVGTLIPMRSGGFSSDGARLLLLAQGGPATDRFLATLALLSASLGGMRPRDWNEALLRRAVSLPDGSSDHLSARWMAYAHTLDCGQVEQAGQALDDILSDLDTWPAAFRTGVLLEAAYFTAHHRRQPDAARGLLEQAGQGTLVSRSTRLSTEAEILLAEGRVAEAVAKAQQGIDALPQSIGGVSPVERERLEAVIARNTQA